MLDPRDSKKLQLALAIVAVIALLFQHDLVAALWIFLVVPVLGLVGAAWLLAFDAFVALIRRKPARHFVSAAVLAICLGPAFPYVNRPFEWVAAAHKLLWNQSHYSAVVRRVQAGEVVDEIYNIDEGPPPRYMFVWGAFGAPDNCFGVVHDESQTFDGAPANVFGGCLVYEVHLWGPWYFVQFT